MTGGDAASTRPLTVVLLAAGQGKRLGAEADLPPKVLLDCLGLPMLEHVRRALAPLGADTTLVVTGHRADEVETWLDTHWEAAQAVRQVPQNGTGHATRLALEAAPELTGDVLVVYGDVPQLRSDDLERLLDAHREHAAAATVLTGVTEHPGLLGRVVRDEGTGGFLRVVEARDADPAELRITEFNTGLYAFDAARLRAALAGLSADNDQGEEYLTDALEAIVRDGRVEAVPAGDPDSLLGVNDWVDLASAVAVLRRRICSAHMRRGVRITDPDTTVIEADVEIAPGAEILPFTHVGTGCRIAAGAVVGPFARLRGGTVLEAGAQIGNFVEVKASVVGPGAKAKHLAYLGDAEVGERANVGCGAVTANYDGTHKHKTIIGAGASIGSGTILVAPVEVGPGARTGANAVVLPGDGVPPGRTAVGVPSRVLPSDRDSGEDARSEQDGASGEEQTGEST